MVRRPEYRRADCGRSPASRHRSEKSPGMTTKKGVKSATEATVNGLQEIDPPVTDDQFPSHGERGAGRNADQPDLFAASGTPQTNRQLVVELDTKADDAPAGQDDYPDFNWNDEEAVVFRRQLAVAVYRTPDGGLVIRQGPDWNDEDDACIAISSENVGAFVDRLTEVVDVPSLGGPEVPPPPVRRR